MNAEVLIKFKGDTSDVDSKANKLNTSFGKLTGAMALGNLAAQGITKGMQVVSQSLDGAIARVDTMNNFPKVMENLGIAAEDSSEVVADLSEKLKGLPTTLDSATSAVQRLTTSTGDVKEAEDLFLSFNNALLAGGASTEIQASALEQFSQAVAKGKPDMQEWRSMLTAMPAQLSQVAKDMNYESVAALGEAVRADGGEAEFQKMLESIKKLNKEGTGEFASFTDQAKGSVGGIKTSITNMKTAFVRGVGNIIKSVDKSLASVGGLSGVIGKLGQVGEKIFTSLGETITQILPPLIEIAKSVMPAISGIFQMIMPTLSQLIQTLLPVLLQVIQSLLPPLMELIQMLLPPLMQIIQAIIPLLKPLADLLTPLIKIAMAIITPLVNIITQILPPFIELLSTILQVILPPLTAAIDLFANVLSAKIQFAFSIVQPIIDLLVSRFNNIKTILENVIGFIKNVFTGNWKAAWQNVKNIFSSIVSGFVNIIKFPINTIINLINSFIKGLNKIKIPNWVPGVGGKGINIPLIPKLATGTNYVPEDMVALIHQGEAVVPKKFNPYANGIDTQLTSSMQNTFKPNIQVYNNVNIEQDPLGQLVHNIKTYSGGSPNDYNYGAGV